MLVYILRHGHSEHLAAGFRQRVNTRGLAQSIGRWKGANLTHLGKEQAGRAGELLRGSVSAVWSSPLPRAAQTAKLVAGDMMPVQTKPLLCEIHEQPWPGPRRLRLRESTWFVAAFFCVMLDGRWRRLCREAREVLSAASAEQHPVLLVTHKARLLSLLVYARLHPRWRVLRTDTNPCGISVLEWK